MHNFTSSRLSFDPILLGGRDDLLWVDPEAVSAYQSDILREGFAHIVGLRAPLAVYVMRPVHLDVFYLAGVQHLGLHLRGVAGLRRSGAPHV